MSERLPEQREYGIGDVFYIPSPAYEDMEVVVVAEDTLGERPDEHTEQEWCDLMEGRG